MLSRDPTPCIVEVRRAIQTNIEPARLEFVQRFDIDQAPAEIGTDFAKIFNSQRAHALITNFGSRDLQPTSRVTLRILRFTAKLLFEAPSLSVGRSRARRTGRSNAEASPKVPSFCVVERRPAQRCRTEKRARSPLTV